MNPRLPCIVNPEAPDNCTPILACEAPAVYSCGPRGCVCLDPPAPTLKCTVVITYPQNDPGTMYVSVPGACEASLELALAALLAKLLAQ